MRYAVSYAFKQTNTKWVWVQGVGMPSRRSVLVGLGGLVAGGGALIGTGAFTTVEAQRTVNVETADDADAFLGLSPDDRDSSTQNTVENAYVSETDGTLQINLDGNGTNSNASGLNQNARTTFRRLVEIANNGTQEVTSITLEFTTTPSGVDPNNTFQFTVSGPDSAGSNRYAHSSGGTEILTGDSNIPSSLTAGSAVDFGLEIDLIDGGNSDNDLPDNGSYELTIRAETANS